MDWTKIYSMDAIVTRKHNTTSHLIYESHTPNRTWVGQLRLPAGLERDSPDSQPNLSWTTQTPSRTWAEQPKLSARQHTDRIKLKETNLNNWDNYL